MRPTIAEQLEGSCRLLEDVIAPELESDYARGVLAGLVKNFRMLESSWEAMIPFLEWDNGEVIALLRQAQSLLADSISVRIAMVGSEPVGLDGPSLTVRNEVLRGLLSEVVLALHEPSAEPSGDLDVHITEYFKARLQRYPMRMVPELSAANAPKEA